MAPIPTREELVYGVPPDLDLTPFHGARLEQIALGEFIVHFRFAADPYAEVSVEGKWELRDPVGGVLDRYQPNAERTAYRVHVLLGRTVTGSEVSAPDWFALRFDGGYSLRVYDSSREYESFSIQPGDIFV